MGIFNKQKKIEENYDKELNDFYKLVAKSKRIDNMFSLPTDENLTEDEIKAIDEFWGKYKFAYPEIDYKSFKTFKNRYGKFDVRHCPGAIRIRYFQKYFVDDHYSVTWQHKGMLPILYPTIKQPKTVIRRMNGLFSDTDYNPLTLKEVINILYDRVSQGHRLIMKTSNLGGGKGILFIEPTDTKEIICDKIAEIGIRAFVIQELLEQSDFMKQFNPTSVNTLRVTSLIHKGKVHILAALIRVGKVGNEVDNYSQGGSLLGIDKETGICNAWALTHDHERITTLPSGVVLDKEPLVVPNFEEVKKVIQKAHCYIPYIRMISWDIALDKENEPVLIENNFAGMIQIHEAVTGPLFGDLMEELCDTYLLEKFHVNFTANDWLCEEYHDHIVLAKYLGEGVPMSVPDTIKGKPVTQIKDSALPKKNLEEIMNKVGNAVKRIF